jgi:hypothetical protein
MSISLVKVKLRWPSVRVVRLLWSSDWYSRHPWKDGEIILPYVGMCKERHNDISLRAVWFGPLYFVVGSMM